MQLDRIKRNCSRSGPALRRPTPAQTSLPAAYNAAGRGTPVLAPVNSSLLLIVGTPRTPARAPACFAATQHHLVGTLHAPVPPSARSGPRPTSIRPKGHPSTDAGALEFYLHPTPYNAAGRGATRPRSGPATPSLCGLSGIPACAPGLPSAALLQHNLLCRRLQRRGKRYSWAPLRSTPPCC